MANSQAEASAKRKMQKLTTTKKQAIGIVILFILSNFIVHAQI